MSEDKSIPKEEIEKFKEAVERCVKGGYVFMPGVEYGVYTKPTVQQNRWDWNIPLWSSWSIVWVVWLALVVLVGFGAYKSAKIVRPDGLPYNSGIWINLEVHGGVVKIKSIANTGNSDAVVRNLTVEVKANLKP